MGANGSSNEEMKYNDRLSKELGTVMVDQYENSSLERSNSFDSIVSVLDLDKVNLIHQDNKIEDENKEDKKDMGREKGRRKMRNEKNEIFDELLLSSICAEDKKRNSNMFPFDYPFKNPFNSKPSVQDESGNPYHQSSNRSHSQTYPEKQKQKEQQQQGREKNNMKNNEIKTSNNKEREAMFD